MLLRLATAAVLACVCSATVVPAEEAAARIEKMPAPMAVQVLRTVKSKTAGAILAQVRPDKAAKLTEQIVNATAPPASSVPSKATR